MPSKPKRSARERLVGEFDQNIEKYAPAVAQRGKARFRRLLRAHERELAERANGAIDAALSQAECPADCPCRASVAALRSPLRAAILGPQATGRRGKR